MRRGAPGSCSGRWSPPWCPASPSRTPPPSARAPSAAPTSRTSVPGCVPPDLPVAGSRMPTRTYRAAGGNSSAGGALPQVLDEPGSGGGAGPVEVLDVGVEVAAREQLQPFRLACPLVGLQGEVGRRQVVVGSDETAIGSGSTTGIIPGGSPR